MKALEKTLNKLDGILLSIERNTVEGRYELKIGLPSSWTYQSTDIVEIEELKKTEDAVLLNVFSDSEDVVIDDLVDFVNTIVLVNEEIAQRQEKFDKLMEQRRKELEDEFNKYEEELELLRKKSFNNLSDDQTKKKSTDDKKDKKSQKNTVNNEKNIDELQEKFSN